MHHSRVKTLYLGEFPLLHPPYIYIYIRIASLQQQYSSDSVPSLDHLSSAKHRFHPRPLTMEPSRCRNVTPRITCCFLGLLGGRQGSPAILGAGKNWGWVCPSKPGKSEGFHKNITFLKTPRAPTSSVSKVVGVGGFGGQNLVRRWARSPREWMSAFNSIHWVQRTE